MKKFAIAIIVLAAIIGGAVYWAGAAVGKIAPYPLAACFAGGLYGVFRLGRGVSAIVSGSSPGSLAP